MLVLKRKKHQSIDLAGVGRITILETNDHFVNVGLEIDPSIRVKRSELDDKPLPKPDALACAQ